MRKLAAFIAIMLAGAFGALAQSLVFEGAVGAPVSVGADKNTGLDGLYVLENANGVVASLSGQSGAVRWYRFSSYGGAYAEEVGQSASITLTAEDCGLIAEVGDRRYCFWIVNYANHRLDLRSLSIDAEQECDRAHLTLDGDAQPIHYFTINGQRRDLSRQLTLAYSSLEYDAVAASYVQREVKTEIASVEGRINIGPPLCDTYFTLSGDRFLEAWGASESIESPLYTATAVEAHTTAEQDENLSDNQQDGGVDGLGGSAPCTVHFIAAVTDAAEFVEWQMSRDPEFEVIDDRYRETEFEYTFRDNGTTYVRFVANNAAGTCEYLGETYEIFIGESSLLCPNAFSPGASEGVNDEWKVSYKSIVKFECHIFNRWGTKLFESTDPSVGWDGKYKGKLVPSGVYYYVIKAVGSEGRKYNLSGDINILRTKSSGYQSGSTPPTE